MWSGIVDNSGELSWFEFVHLVEPTSVAQGSPTGFVVLTGQGQSCGECLLCGKRVKFNAFVRSSLKYRHLIQLHLCVSRRL